MNPRARRAKVDSSRVLTRSPDVFALVQGKGGDQSRFVCWVRGVTFQDARLAAGRVLRERAEAAA